MGYLGGIWSLEHALIEETILNEINLKERRKSFILAFVL